jgi:uncharacterized protein (TIGR00255 family)
MLKSMTGYGRGHYEGDFFACTAEIKSVNHRFLDLHLKLPAELSHTEVQIKRLVQSRLKRGRVDLFLEIDRNEAIGFTLNEPLLRAYLKTIEELRRGWGLNGEVDLVQLLRVPGIVNLELMNLPEQAKGTVQDGVLQAVAAALQTLDFMRVEEGRSLQEDMQRRIEKIREGVSRVQSMTNGVLTAHQERLQARLTELLKGAPLEPGRLIQEAAFYVERSDITEELTRLDSHIEQSTNLLKGGEDVGKTLDFLLQEMGREANTILSKTTGLAGQGLEISNHALRIKAEIEKIREQIQNVE